MKNCLDEISYDQFRKEFLRLNAPEMRLTDYKLTHSQYGFLRLAVKDGYRNVGGKIRTAQSLAKIGLGRVELNHAFHPSKLAEELLWKDSVLHPAAIDVLEFASKYYAFAVRDTYGPELKRRIGYLIKLDLGYVAEGKYVNELFITDKGREYLLNLTPAPITSEKPDATPASSRPV